MLKYLNFLLNTSVIKKKNHFCVVIILLYAFGTFSKSITNNSGNLQNYRIFNENQISSSFLN